MIINLINHFLRTYAYGSCKEFICSMFPNSKYGLMSISVSFSAVSGFMSQYLGVGPLIAVGMFVAIVIEILSGIQASQKQKKPFESFKFSRCIIKLFFWLGLIFFINSFQVEYSEKTADIDIQAYIYFGIAKLGIMMLFIVEHATSIAENIAVIDGREKTAYIDMFKNLLTHGFKLLKNLFK